MDRDSQLRELYEFEDRYWWFVGLRRIVISQVAKTLASCKKPLLLDAGFGAGAMLLELNKYGMAFGVDISPEALTYSKKRKLTNLINSSVTSLPLKSNSFDAVISLDVLCDKAVEDDLKALKEFNRVLKKGGRIFINLPAFNLFFSSQHRMVQVRERYMKKELSGKIIKAGFKIEKISYWNSFLFPFIAAMRLIKQSIGTSQPINGNGL